MSPKQTTPSVIPTKKVVLIELTEIKSSSGLEYVTEKKQETGKVVAIGNGVMPVKMKVGDTIVFRKFGEDKLFIDGKEYLFVTFADVLGTIK